jgi:hypothetical protein
MGTGYLSGLAAADAPGQQGDGRDGADHWGQALDDHGAHEAPRISLPDASTSTERSAVSWSLNVAVPL